MNTARTSTRTSTRGALAACVALVGLLAGSSVFGACALAGRSSVGCVGSYGWPVAPFHRQHPIRGNFGDPRTVFDGTLTEDTLLRGRGTFSFHHGVDVSAPDGAPVYSVSSGTVTRTHGGRVTVTCHNGRRFQYWHVDAVARVGQRAVAGRTILGFVQQKREHVHLTHVESGRPVNPLHAGRLTPYRDETVPAILDIEVRRPDGAPGRLHFVVEAIDTPARAVPGRWHGFPVTPAWVAWRIEGAGRTVVPTQTAHDVRQTLPARDRFWVTFARGAHQNWPVFAKRKVQGLAGTYLFRLTPEPLDARKLRAGAYVLVLSVEDTAGNRDVRRLEFTVHAADL